LIPRYQTILLAIMVLASLGMGTLLWHMREKAHQEMLQGQDAAPTAAPDVAVSVQATLLVANDDDNGLREEDEALPLPADDGARARAILNKLFEIYAAPGATHPVPAPLPAVRQVFLLPDLAAVGSYQIVRPGTGRPVTKVLAPDPVNGPELAVVNLAPGFAASHPSGLETETLTVLSICRTIHANLPRVAEIRFLVDGEPRATLAGHADLTRIYLVSDAISASPAASSVQP
jgi:hypothetical protein